VDGLETEICEEREDYRLRVRCDQGVDAEIGIGFRLDFPEWQGAHVSLPAAVYAGNRFRSKPYAYSCIVNDPEDFRADLPNTISNVPRMPHIQLLAGDAAMPGVGVANFETGVGVWILTDPHPSIGAPLLEVTESDTGLSIYVLTPGVREGERYFGCGEKWVPSEDRGWRPEVGETAELRIRIHTFPASNPHDLYESLFSRRHEIWPAGGRHEIPWSAAFDLIEDKFNRTGWDETDGYYACGDRLSRYAHWQIGWVGGGISSHALLTAGTETSRTRARRTMDYMAGKGQSPSGFYWSFGVDGEVYSDMIDMDYGHDWHLVRRSGDALYFFVKQIHQAEAQGHIEPSWTQSIIRCADAFVTLWRREGQFGQFVSQITGEIRVGATASGAIAPAGLALAYQLTGREEYLATAIASARYYVSTFLDAGYTSGGPGEAAQCPDSESAFGLLESLVTLYEVTEDRQWLPLAERAAWLCASWVMPYDFQFPPNSSFGHLDMRTTGSVWANSQNKHSAPGICTLSGVSLLKLFRATGDWRYQELLAEIAHGVVQYTSRDDRPVFEMPSGYMCERVNTSDWEHPVTPVGEGFNASCWCETSALLTHAELPGLYAQLGTGRLVILDHVDAEVIDVSASSITLALTNPTNFPMRLRVMVEAYGDLPPLGQDFAVHLPIFEIDAGQTIRVELAGSEFHPLPKSPASRQMES
jgi:hypothetical protein